LKPAKLWPSLAHIRSEFYPDLLAQMPNDGGRQGVSHASKTTPQQRLGPLQDLLRRREAVAARKFSSSWEPGKLVLIKVLASARPVLLTQAIGVDQWAGYLVAPECDWAGAFDVLLEPTDEPFDPLCGMVQCWNPVLISSRPHQDAHILGQLSAARLHMMSIAASDMLRTDNDRGTADPGIIALRSLSDDQTVLTGSAVGEIDVRLEFQALYRRLAKAISI
jgi:hypothetical protein